MSALLFLTNHIQDPDKRAVMRIPLTFVGFALRPGKMFRHYRNESTFIVPHHVRSKKRDSRVVYGSLWICDDYHYFASILDAMHECSLSLMKKNHPMDVHHRLHDDVYPIRFNTLEQFASQKYQELDPIKADYYEGNLNHPKIKMRIERKSMREVHGVDAKPFVKLFKEVSNDKKQ